jgi:hypothetical protein
MRFFQVLDDLFGNPQAAYSTEDGGIGLWRGWGVDAPRPDVKMFLGMTL